MMMITSRLCPESLINSQSNKSDTRVQQVSINISNLSKSSNSSTVSDLTHHSISHKDPFIHLLTVKEFIFTQNSTEKSHKIFNSIFLSSSEIKLRKNEKLTKVEKIK
jgi:hypothetical protein